MKRYIFFLLLISSPLLSCKKFLQTVPQDFVTPQNYFNTEADLQLALNGVYNRLVDNLGRMYSKGLYTNFVLSDEFFYTGTTNLANNLKVMDFDANSLDIGRLWEVIYQGIDRANVLLKNINKPTMDENRRNVIKGEALFLRAYYYFLLVDMYGGVPLRLSPAASPAEVNLPRSSVAEVYAQIVKDMKEAENLVNSITAYTYNERVTKTVVQSVLARVFLTMAGKPLEDVSKYRDALDYANKVIGSGLHGLNPSYSQIFINHTQDKYDLQECIWEIGMYGNKMEGAEDLAGFVGIENGVTCSDLTIGYSGGIVRTTAKLFGSFEANDLRRDWSVSTYRWVTNATTGITSKTNYTAAQVYDRPCGKWRREYETLVPKHRNYSSTNFPVMRYADVLLMAAEAENALNGPDEAVGYINEVRRRAYGAGKTIKTITVTNQGSGYPAAAQIQILINGGTPTNVTGFEPFSAVPVVTGGRITAINIIGRGTFYGSAPTITIQSATGSGATATVAMTTNADADVPAANKADEVTLLKFIQDERSRELCFEGIRKHDLVRWGMYVSSMNDLARQIRDTAPTNYKFAARAGENTTARNVVFPIPNTEMTSNSLMGNNQNLGW